MTDLSGNEINYSGKPAYVKAEGGVLATLHDHQAFLEKLKPAMATKKWYLLHIVEYSCHFK